MRRRKKGGSPGEKTPGERTICLEEDLVQERGGCSPGEKTTSSRDACTRKTYYTPAPSGRRFSLTISPLPGACAIGGAGSSCNCRLRPCWSPSSCGRSAAARSGRILVRRRPVLLRCRSAAAQGRNPRVLPKTLVDRGWGSPWRSIGRPGER